MDAAGVVLYAITSGDVNARCVEQRVAIPTLPLCASAPPSRLLKLRSRRSFTAGSRAIPEPARREFRKALRINGMSESA
jgi:hypothetical protein